MMDKLKLTIFFLTLSISFLLAQQADDLIGIYRLPNELEIEIFKEGNLYNGRIVALNTYQNGETKDVKNPDRSKRNELLLGKIIIKGLQFDEQNKVWGAAIIYGPEKGMTANLKVTEMRENEIEVVASKYFFWRTLKWQKSE